MLEEIGNALKKVGYGAVGAVSKAGKKAGEFAGNLVKTGEQIVEDSRQKTSDLKHDRNLKDAQKILGKMTEEERQELMESLKKAEQAEEVDEAVETEAPEAAADETEAPEAAANEPDEEPRVEE